MRQIVSLFEKTLCFTSLFSSTDSLSENFDQMKQVPWLKDKLWGEINQLEQVTLMKEQHVWEFRLSESKNPLGFPARYWCSILNENQKNKIVHLTMNRIGAEVENNQLQTQTFVGVSSQLTPKYSFGKSR